MNVFSCNIDKCGRKFNKKDELKEHCTRRHSGHIGSNSAIPQTKPISDQLHSETPLNLKANKIIMSEIGKLTLKKPFFMPKKKLPTPLLKPSPKEVENANELTQIKQKNENKEDFQIKNNGSSFIEDKSHDNTTFNSISFNKEANENFVGNLVDLSQDKRMFEDLMKDDDDSLEMIESPGIEKLELEQILSSKEKLTEEFLIKKSGICEKLEHITTVILFYYKILLCL